jgi:hypothetical protein
MFRKAPERGGYSGERTWGGRAGAVGIGDQLKEGIASRLLTRPTNLLMVAEGVSVHSTTELREMKSWFNDRGWDVRVLCCVRWLSSWISSMVSQRVTGFQHLTIKSAVAEFVAASSLVRARITNIREVFPDAEFYSFEVASSHRRGPVGFFFDAIGIRPTERMLFARANEGRSDCATRLLSSINEEFGPGVIDGTVNPRHADNRVSSLNAIPGPKFALRRDEVLPLLPMLVAENEWLKDTLGEQYHDPRLEFGDEPCGWTEESRAQLSALLDTSTPVVRSLAASHLAASGYADRAGTTTRGH